MDIGTTSASMMASARINDLGSQPSELKLSGDKARDLERVSEFAREFEEMLVRQLLKQANQPMFNDEEGFMGVSNPIYKDMYLEQVAHSISSSGTLGLAEQLKNQLNQQLKLTDEPEPDKPGNGS